MRASQGLAVGEEQALAGLGQHLLELFVEAGGRFLLPAVSYGLLVGVDAVEAMADELAEILDEGMVGAGTVAGDEGWTRTEEGLAA